MTTAVIPKINREKCEGKSTCVEVCPFNVLSMGKLSSAEFSSLSLRGKIKAFAHGKKQAYVTLPDVCESCALCVSSCPEKAITLVQK